MEAVANGYYIVGYTQQADVIELNNSEEKKITRSQKREERKKAKAQRREDKLAQRAKRQAERQEEKREVKSVRQMLRDQRRDEVRRLRGVESLEEKRSRKQAKKGGDSLVHNHENCDCEHHTHTHNHQTELDSISVDSLSSIYQSKPVARDTAVNKPTSTAEVKPPVTDAATREYQIEGDSVVDLPSPMAGEKQVRRQDTLPRVKLGFLDNVLSSSNADSMIFNMSANKMYLYKGAELDYGESKLTGSFMTVDLNTNVIKAIGEVDSLGNYIKSKFIDKGQEYDMDSLAYNLRTRKAKISGGYRKEGEGFIHGEALKMVDNEHFNIKAARYTTCDCPEPHFYLASTKAQLIQGKNSKKIIAGPSYLVLEGVPLYPFVIPFMFFPIMSDRNSGVIIPEYGEESQKGFYLRNGGYYFAFNDYIDARITAGIYTYGSWEANLASTYRVRYKFNGNLALNFSKDKIGEPEDSDYVNGNNYRITWTHSQDPKFKPNSTFSASVNFSTSSYNKYNGNIEDYISAQTNSSISYSKNWSGKPFSFSASMQHSQNNRDSTITMTLPNMSFNVSRIYPFRRKAAVGEQKWYEQIGFTYSGTFNNSLTVKESQFLTADMFDVMKYGFNHSIPVSTSITALKHLKINPSVNYQERWYFTRENRTWNPETEQVDISDESGFYRIYNYSMSLSFSTILYGMFQFKDGKAIKAIRHMMTPSVSLSYAPNFGDAKFGYYRDVQVDSQGNTTRYSPYQAGIYGVPGSGESGTISLSLSNTLEMKVKSKRDTSGVAKIKIFESLDFRTSYNMLADSMNLSPISISARTTLFKSLGINASATYDPYKYTELGQRTSALGKGRITTASLSFGYSFRSVFGHEGEGSGTGSETLPRNLTAEENRMIADNNINPNAAVSLLQPEYYNFSIPWNLSMNYILAYSNSGANRNVDQTISYNGSVTLTSKWGLSFSGTLNLQTFEPTPGTVSIDRDLHCWQMGFSWVPVGFRKSWSFNIRVKSSILQDLKLEKSSGYLDNLY